MNGQIKEDIKDLIHFIENVDEIIFLEIQGKLERIISNGSRNVMYSMQGDPVFQKLHTVSSIYGQNGNKRDLINGLKNCL